MNKILERLDLTIQKKNNRVSKQIAHCKAFQERNRKMCRKIWGGGNRTYSGLRQKEKKRDCRRSR